MLIITTKTGDTFKQDFQRLDSGGSPVDVSGLTIAAKIQGESFEDALSVTVTDAATGLFSVTATPAATALWPSRLEGVSPPQVAYCDVKYDDGTNVEHSETIKVVLIKGIA